MFFSLQLHAPDPPKGGTLADSVLKIWVTFWATGLKRGAGISKKAKSPNLQYFQCVHFFILFFFFLVNFLIFLCWCYYSYTSKVPVLCLWDIFVVDNLSELFFLKCIRGILALKKPNSNEYHNQEKKTFYCKSSPRHLVKHNYILMLHFFPNFSWKSVTKVFFLLRAIFLWVSLTGITRTNCEEFPLNNSKSLWHSMTNLSEPFFSNGYHDQEKQKYFIVKAAQDTK